MYQNRLIGEIATSRGENPMGEGENGDLRLDFDGHLRLEFRGARVTTDAGLLAVRELDEALGLTEMAGVMIKDGRTGRNISHELTGLLRQSVYARLAGYEDVNDHERLFQDPAMRAVIGRKALERSAASSQTVSRFETETLATHENVGALAAINHAWVSKAMRSTGTKKVILDMDSSEFPVHGNQEGSAYNGHFCSRCYHPLLVFNQYGDCEGAYLRPGKFTRQTAGGTCCSPSWKDTGLWERSSTSRPTPPLPPRTSMHTLRTTTSSTP
jgi:hypothetical protein